MKPKTSRKKYDFKQVKGKSVRSKKKFIDNQCTILGAHFKLMMTEKLILALIRVKESFSGDQTKEKTIPVVFKIENEKIPKCLKNLKISRENLIHIYVPGASPIPGMAVIIAEDSKDLHENFKNFLIPSAEKMKIKNLPPTITNWFKIKGITIDHFEARGVPVVESEDFQLVLQQVETLWVQEQYSNANFWKKMVDNKKKVPPSATSTDSKKDEVSCVELSDDSTKTVPKTIVETAEKFHKPVVDLQPLREAADKIGSSSIKKWCHELIKILCLMVHEIKQEKVPEATVYKQSSVSRSKSKYPKHIGEDKTLEEGKIILLEGILPLNAKKYRSAMRHKQVKPPIEPSASLFMKNIINIAFPKHWIENVTLRGSGDRRSIIQIWNYVDPHSIPLTGPVNDGLGDMRLKAFIHHVLRKSGKDSYDYSMERFLTNSFAKSLHYTRSKLEAKNEQSSSQDSDTNFSYDNTYSDDDGNWELEDEELTGPEPTIPIARKDFNRLMASENESENSKDSVKSNSSIALNQSALQSAINLQDANKDNLTEDGSLDLSSKVAGDNRADSLAPEGNSSVQNIPEENILGENILGENILGENIPEEKSQKPAALYTSDVQSPGIQSLTDQSVITNDDDTSTGHEPFDYNQSTLNDDNVSALTTFPRQNIPGAMPGAMPGPESIDSVGTCIANTSESETSVGSKRSAENSSPSPLKKKKVCEKEEINESNQLEKNEPKESPLENKSHKEDQGGQDPTSHDAVKESIPPPTEQDKEIFPYSQAMPGENLVAIASGLTPEQRAILSMIDPSVLMSFMSSKSKE